MASATSPASWRAEPGARDIWTLWFDQAGRTHNVLDERALDELETSLDQAARQASVRAVVIRSAKERGFCSGADLATIARAGAAELRAYLRRGLAVLEQLAACAVPTVAVLHGICHGAGLELALACRHRVALASAAPLKLGMPEVQYGLVPAWGAITALPRLIGPADALDLLLSGRSLGYLSARSLGIVDRLASEADSSELLDLLEARAPVRRSWPPEAWQAAWQRAQSEVEDQPGEHPEAQSEIVRIMAIDLAEGPQAAREAAIEAAAALAAREETREAIASVLRGEEELLTS
jgi:enoyl-CoA hydratase/carnithine racemase